MRDGGWLGRVVRTVQSPESTRRSGQDRRFTNIGEKAAAWAHFARVEDARRNYRLKPNTVKEYKILEKFIRADHILV